MHGFRRERNEIPEGVVPGCRLRKSAVRFHFYGMDEVRKFNGILDEENRDVVADQIPIALLRVKLDGKSTHVARSIYRARAACDGRYTGKQGCLLTHLGKHFGGGVFFQRGGQLKETMHARPSRVNDTLRDTFVIEMRDFFAQDEILQECRTARICFE